MSIAQEDTRRIAERAAQYLGALTEGNAERAGLFAWLAESPRHVEEFLFVLKSAQDIAGITAEQEARIAQMAAEAEAAGAGQAGGKNIVDLHSNRSLPLPQAEQTRNARTHWRRWGIAATLAITGLVWWQLSGIGEWNTYTTAIGEQRAIKLADGSMVHLNTHSRLQVRFTQDTRSLRLVEGEALFTVERDALRPFRVHAGDAVIQALGTQFDVYRRESGMRVSVLQGAVQISGRRESPLTEKAAGSTPPRLIAGEEADIAKGGKILARERVNLAKATAWQQRRLVFEDEPLQAIVEEFNRYNISPRIRIGDEVARGQHFSGTFDADAPEKMVQTLVRDEMFVVTRTEDEILIRTRESAAAP